jgi:hypothetical protein
VGDEGHADDFQAYFWLKISSPCAFNARWKKKVVNAMMAQFEKNDALVIEMNQLRASVPPATLCQYVSYLINLGLVTYH